MVVLFDSEPSESHRSTIKQNRKVSGVESLFLDEAPVKNFGVVAEPGLLYRIGNAKGHVSGLVGSNPTDTPPDQSWRWPCHRDWIDLDASIETLERLNEVLV